MKQSDIFLQGEGQAWYERNKNKLPPEHDPVMEIIEKVGITPNHVLEVGCGNGWRLDKLWETYACNTTGIDPFSDRLFSRGRYVIKGTAAALPGRRNEFDLIIYGFCLYLVDREDLFKVVAEGDRVLQDGGYLIIHDFFVMMDPYKRKYEHKDGVFSYKMNYFKLWTANPAYQVIETIRPDDDTVVHLLKKDVDKGWPLHE